jgi:Ca2+-binding RTX toxin-like protein
MATITDIDDGKGRVLTGTPGEDNTINGLGGDDYLVGQEGQDLLYGGDGNDSFEGGAGSDFFWGQAGADTVEFRGFGSDLDYFMDFKASERDKVDVKALNISSFDTLKALLSVTEAGLAIGWGENADLLCSLTLSGIKKLGQAKAGQFVFSTNDTNDVLTLDDGGGFVSGGLGDDTITGGAGNDVIIGDQGNDILHSGGGARDRIYGGAGADSIYVDGLLGAAADGGKGIDMLTLQVDAALFRYDYSVDLDSGTIEIGGAKATFSNIEIFAVDGFAVNLSNVNIDIHCTDGEDVLMFRYRDNNYIPGVTDVIGVQVHGSAGADIIDAGIGYHVTVVYDTRVKIDRANADKSTGDAKGDILKGVNFELSAGNDVYIGAKMGGFIDAGGGDDDIRGSSRQDLITGGEGTDTLDGRGGADIYFFRTPVESTNKRPDRVNFEDGVDLMSFALIDANVFTNDGDETTWGDHESFTVVDMFTSVAGQLQWDHLLIKGRKETWIEGDVDGDGRADFTVILEGHVAFTREDVLELNF